MSLIDYDSVAAYYDRYVTLTDDVPFLVQEARGVRGPVLELMAGTGRLSLPLADAGVDLTCVDASARMLDALRAKLAGRRTKPLVQRADVRALALPQRYELAVLGMQSFMELIGEADQRAALAGVYAALVPNGRFVCTLHNPTARRRTVDGVLRLVGEFPGPDGTLVVSGFERGGDPVVVRLQFLELFADTGELRWKRALTMRFELVEAERFAALAADAGFQVDALYGDYARAAFDARSSPFAVFVLRKPSP